MVLRSIAFKKQLIWLLYPLFMLENEVLETNTQTVTINKNSDAHNLRRTTRERPVPPVQPHDCWLLNPYMVTDRTAFGS